MTYYHPQVLQSRANVYPADELCAQIIRAKAFIDNQYYKRIRLHEVAGEAFISKFHFIRLFKKSYGRTPGRYLAEVRVAKAKQLLQTDASVAEVCFSVGFDSTTSFCGLFTKITGITPSAYQKSTRQKSNFRELRLKLIPEF